MMQITREAVMFIGKLIVKFFLTKQFWVFFSVRFNHFLLQDLFSLYYCFLWAWLDMTNFYIFLNWQLNHCRNCLWHFNVYCSRGFIFVWPNAKWSVLICICWDNNESQCVILSPCHSHSRLLTNNFGPDGMKIQSFYF